MRKQGSIVNGLILIVIGLCFLAVQLVPGLGRLVNFAGIWPLMVLGLGGIFLFSAVVGRTSPLAIPGSILSGIGLILLYQNSTHNWHHWQLWLLVPAFVGVGLLGDSLLSGRGLRGAMPAAGILGVIGLGLFFVFTAVRLWPVFLILLGVALLIRNLRRRV
jgi:hypothetical protein